MVRLGREVEPTLLVQNILVVLQIKKRQQPSLRSIGAFSKRVENLGGTTLQLKSYAALRHYSRVTLRKLDLI